MGKWVAGGQWQTALALVWYFADAEKKDGCPGGESPQQITERLDALIADIRKRFHAHAIGKPKGSQREPFGEYDSHKPCRDTT